MRGKDSFQQAQQRGEDQDQYEQDEKRPGQWPGVEDAQATLGKHHGLHQGIFQHQSDDQGQHQWNCGKSPSVQHKPHYAEDKHNPDIENELLMANTSTMM